MISVEERVTSTEAFDRRLLGGRYRLEEKIGQGGMGLVVRAIDVVLSREVAIKLVTHETTVLDEEIASRFLRAAPNTTRFAHENIVGAYDTARAADAGRARESLTPISVATKRASFDAATAGRESHGGSAGLSAPARIPTAGGGEGAGVSGMGGAATGSGA